VSESIAIDCHGVGLGLRDGIPQRRAHHGGNRQVSARLVEHGRRPGLPRDPVHADQRVIGDDRPHRFERLDLHDLEVVDDAGFLGVRELLLRREDGAAGLGDDLVAILFEEVAAHARDDVAADDRHRETRQHDRQDDGAQLERAPPEPHGPGDVGPPVESHGSRRAHPIR
jgi:hypothetical protein